MEMTELDNFISVETEIIDEYQDIGPNNPLKQIFKIKDLKPKEIQDIEILLKENSTKINNFEFQNDFRNISRITTEIRGVNRMHSIFLGGKIIEARNILEKYGDKTFSKWLELTFGNRRTPYDYIYQYEFFSALSEQYQEIALQMPRSILSIVCKKKLPFEEKLELVANYRGEKKHELVKLIKDKFSNKEMATSIPKESSNKEKQSLLKSLEIDAIKLGVYASSSPFTDSQKKKVQEIINILLNSI
jgi:hypothetical protein